MPRPYLGVSVAAALLLGASNLWPAPVNRITGAVDSSRMRVIPGNLHGLDQPRYDRGPADPATPMNNMVVLFKPSAAQQADLDTLLADQQNPSSPHFHKWLTPEEFGNRFGLSPGDQSKVAAWLNSQGFRVDHLARGRNWIAFSGTAGQVARALNTSLHRFQINGESHIANVTEPSVPEALAGVIGGFLGLNDFRPQSFAKIVPPDYDSGASHYLVPADYSTIYDIAPLYQAGIDGAGQSIAVVGESDVPLGDIQAFRAHYNLPANTPKLVPYSFTDPGYNSAQVEADLDLEWAGAIAPKATLYYVYGPSAFTAIIYAVEMNVAPVISISYGYCEVNYSPLAYRSIAQQGNAQGITLLSASGDSGAAGCQETEPFASRGRSVQFPAAMPEVTAVGGTQFSDASGNYWAPSNGTNLGSALSYIPEAAWNESSSAGLAAGGGGASIFYSQPSWQSGPGVPTDGARHVPDVALSSALHDAYMIDYAGQNVPVAGTSAAAPSMAGIVALLNQYQVSNGSQTLPGLGNINPQLYRLAQSAPSAFHDIVTGNNVVSCEQGSPDCATGSFGYQAAPGYDMATGLGSIDANALATQWNSAANGVIVTLSLNETRATLNDTIQATATVSPASGTGTPTGAVSFTAGTIALGSVTLANGSASVTFPAYRLGLGIFSIAAQYSGDASFSAGGSTALLQVGPPVSGAAIVTTAPAVVWPSAADAQGPSWQTQITLREVAGVPAMVTGLTIDGQNQTLSQYFPSPDIPADGSLSALFVFRGLTPPVTRTFVFSGIDATGAAWSRQIAVQYLPLPTDDFFSLNATPLVVPQNTAADPSCQWPVQLNIDDQGGFGGKLISGLFAGGLNITSQVPSIFGTTRLEAWASLQGTLCFGSITPPAQDVIEVDMSDGTAQELTVSFAGPPANPVTISPSPASVSLSSTGSSQATLAVSLSDKTQPWSAAIYPANRTTSWLSVSQLSGAGSSQITLSASGSGFEPGVYRATVVLQSPNAIPSSVSVPVMFVLGGSTSGMTISSVLNAASYTAAASPGMLVSIFGTNLAAATQIASGNPLPYSLSGVSAAVNGIAAPLVYVSPTQINLQIPYEVGAGPAVLGINNNGQIAGFAFRVAPSSPGIFSDVNGNLVPVPAVTAGGYVSLYVTGAGEVSPALKTGYSPFGSLVNLVGLPKPLLPLSVTAGGVPAFIQFEGNSPGLVGTIQINILVPASVAAGNQPVVVTVGGVPSAPVNVDVLSAPASIGSSQ